MISYLVDSESLNVSKLFANVQFIGPYLKRSDLQFYSDVIVAVNYNIGLNSILSLTLIYRQCFIQGGVSLT